MKNLSFNYYLAVESLNEMVIYGSELNLHSTYELKNGVWFFIDSPEYGIGNGITEFAIYND